MKNFNIFKTLLVVAFLGAISVADAQISHPLSFPALGANYSPNWYKNYVGLRFQVSYPASIAGDKGYTTTNDGDTSNTANWGGRPRVFIDSPVKFGPVGDTNGCAAYPPGYFAGKIAIVWRGTCEFGAKAVACQNAGAVACVIVNNVSGGPVGMAAGAVGANDTIPTYMISLNDGMDITSILNSGGTVKMTIVLNWGVGNHNDLGFVPSGYSTSANFATPLSQLMASSHPTQYQNINGAYVANFGLHDATNVKLHSDLSFTPTGGSPSLVYSDSVAFINPITSTNVFRPIDSIFTMFAQPYNIPTITGTGKFDLKYTLTSDSVDAFLGDNVYTHSFYATDSLFSKGRYDFVKNQPVSTYYVGGGLASPYIWGVPYYVANGGSKAAKAQFSVSSAVGPLPGGQQMFVYLFKWVDAGTPLDTLMENSELELVGAGIRTFDGTMDSSFQAFTVDIVDTTGNDVNYQSVLSGNSWYVLAAEVPSGWYLGCDGVVNGYPRSYGLEHFHHVRETYNPLWVGDRYFTTSQVSDPTGAFDPWPFASNVTASSVDSVVYSSQKHILPSLAFTTSTHINAVNEVATPFAKVNLYPNPTADVINVDVALQNLASQVTYTIIDGSGRFVNREIHQNVQNETYTYNTSKLASGNYYVIVSAGTKLLSKKFTVVK